MTRPEHHEKPCTIRHGRFATWPLIAVAVVVILALSTVAWRLLVDRKIAPLQEEATQPTREEGKLPANMGLSWQEMDNPARDGWDTEVFNDKANKVLKKLGKLLSHPEQIDADQLAPLLNDHFSCGPLVPPEKHTIFRDAVLTVARGKLATPAKEPGQPGHHQGASGLATALQSLTAPWREAEDIRFKFKLFRVTPSADAITTRQYLALSGRTKTGMVEENVTWVIRWSVQGTGEEPRITSIRMTDYEQVTSHRSQGPLFADCTHSVLGKNASYRQQFLRGMNHWFERIQDTRYFMLFGNPGLAVGDVNADGLDDLYVCQETGLPNRLFLQQPNGTARDVSEEWGVNWLEPSRGALLVDLDNDGDQDLVVATVGAVIVAENTNSRFTIRAVLPTDDDTMSLSAVDYDNDGDLDLYVCVYFEKEKLEASRGRLLGGVAGAGGDQEGGGRNSLLRNDITQADSWRFTDVTQEVGLEVNNRRHSFAAAWEDFDNDGDQDLYVANDYGQNHFFRNDGGTFTDISQTAGAEDSAFGMSVTWSDYDRDGWMDLYISNMFSAAGGRVTHLDRFKPTSPEQKKRWQRFARGNTLLRNLGNGNFADVSDAAAVTMGRWAWGSNFVDINNDGLEDLVVANGFITTDDSGDL